MRRASDGELCGHVALHARRWQALTVFGARLSEHESREDAIEQVLVAGLASLSERWTLRHRDGTTEIVCIQEAKPTEVTVALGYYSMPGVATLTITAEQLASGEWGLIR